MNIEKLKSRFTALYGEGESRLFFSPSRINLIGEHIDYNGGKVLPCAIEMGTYGLVRLREDNKLLLASENIQGRVETSIEDLKYEDLHGWANYAKGVVYFMKKAGYHVGGMEILIEGNIPNGAGLSSSASLELLIAEMVNVLFNQGEIGRIDLVKISQKAENDFVGVKCGIMDQFAIGMGKENKAILLDTHSLEYEYIDMDLKDNIIVIMNTNKRRELSDSKYNERRRESEKALKVIQKYKEVENLCDLTIEDFEEVKDFIKEEKIRNRAQHAVYENHRVYKASDALKAGDIQELGKLLVESHSSLKNLYEVTGKELDAMVEAANDFAFCLGARMTGAGFGGCAIAILRKDKVKEFIEFVDKEYERQTGYKGEFYISGIAGGTREI